MKDIGKKLDQIEDQFDLSDRFNSIPDPRRSHKLVAFPVVMRLLILMFVFYRTYTLLGIENKQRNRAKEDQKDNGNRTRALFELAAGESATEEQKQTIQEKIENDEPMISDAQIRRIISSIPPDKLSDLAYRMTMKARRNKTWSGQTIVVYDGTSEGGCEEKRCPFCKKANGGEYYHLGVHLLQVNAPPYFVMDHEYARDGEGEATVAKRIGARNIKRANGAYADLVVVDFYYFSQSFFNLHTTRGMDVVTRYHQQTNQIPDKYSILKEANNRIKQGAPDRQFEDRNRNRKVYMWDCGVFEEYLDHKSPIRVVKMLFIDEDGKADLHWLVTTLDPDQHTLRELYEWPIVRWRVEINEFRQQKNFEKLTHKQTHDPEGVGLRNFRMLYLICFNILEWLAWRNLPSIRKRLKNDSGYGRISFREHIKRWLIEYLLEAASRIDRTGRDPPKQ